MARPVQRKAAKDYPQQGIKKGDTYWYVKLKLQRGGIVKRQKEPFKQSQLTTSEFKGAVFDWQDELAKIEDRDAATTAAESIRNIGEEQQEKFENMPEGLQQGSTGELLEERANACEQAADEIDEIVSEWEDAESTWEDEINTYREELAAYREQERKIEAEEDRSEDEELSEPDLPENTSEDGEDEYSFDASDFISSVQEVSVDA